MPIRKYFIDGMTLYKYCKLHDINYNNLFAKACLYKTNPLEALKIKKMKGYTKILKENGITKDNPRYRMYYDRLRYGWDIDKVLNTPRQIGGNKKGAGRKPLDKSKNM